MFRYVVDHCRRNTLQDTLNGRSAQGWRLHSMFEKPSGYELVFEMSDAPSMVIPIEEQKSKKARTVKTDIGRPVEFTKTGDQ